MPEDTPEKLRADIKDTLCEQWLQEWVEAGVRLTQKLQLDPDIGPWDANRILAEIAELRLGLDKVLDRELAARRQRKGTVEAFDR